MICFGIDVSKGKSTVTAISSDGVLMYPITQVEHNLNSMLELANYIKTLSQSDEVRVVCESTGYYHWPLANTLLQEGIWVSILNPIVTSKFSKNSLRNVKTDKIDARKIATYGLMYWDSLQCSPQFGEIFDELKTYSRQYYQYLALRLKARINLICILDQVMPGIQNLLKEDHNNHKLSDFADYFWHFDNITKHRLSTFSRQYQEWHKKKGYIFRSSKAETIYNLAKNSIPILPCTPSTKVLVHEAVKSLHFQEESSVLILTHMSNLAKQLPEYSVITDMPGIGDALATRFIAEIGDVRRFKNKHSLVAYAGIDAPPFQSGNYEGKNRHISKKGNKYLRKTGYEIMRCITSANTDSGTNDVYDFICRKRSEGFEYKKACIAGLNKFLRVYYGKVMAL